MRSMLDLEDSIRDPYVRPHFHEAILAYQSGAYRAAIIESWVAVALDLCEKIRSLADSGNTEAQRFVEKLDKAISKRNLGYLQQLESGKLIDNAKQFGIISHSEAEMLSRLKDDRNRCAHPSFSVGDSVFTPSEELARMSLSSAVDNCLALPSAPGKQVVDRFTEYVDSFSWLSDGQELSAFLRARFLDRVREPTKRRLVDLIIKHAIKPPASEELNNIDTKTYAKRCRCAINAIYGIDSQLVNKGLQNVLTKMRNAQTLDEDALLRFVGAFGHVPRFWSCLEDDEVLQVKALLKNRKSSMLDTSVNELAAGVGVSNLVGLDVFASGTPADERVEAAYRIAVERLAKDPFGVGDALECSTHDSASLIQPALECLKASSSFVASERLLRGLLAVVDTMSVANIRDLGKAASCNDQVYLASRAPSLFKNLISESSNSPEIAEAWRETVIALRDAYDLNDSAGGNADNPFVELVELLDSRVRVIA